MYTMYYLSGNSSNWWLDYPIFDMSKVTFGNSSYALMQNNGLINPSSPLLTMMQNKDWPVYVTDSSHIVFHLVAPFNYFLGTLTVFQGLIFDMQYVLDNGGVGPITNPNPAFALKPIPGTGPYVITQVNVNAFIKFAKNPTYWGKNLSPADIRANPYIDPGHVQNVIIQVRSDDVARYADLSSGHAQVATILDQNWPLILANPDKYSYYTVPPQSMLIVGMAMNVLRYPTNITAVRQAIVHAINYTDVNVKAFGGTMNPWNGPEYPVWTDFYNLGGAQPWPYNVTLAQKILSDNHIDTTKFPPLEFRVLAGCTFCINTAQIVQADLSQIGINVNIEVTPPSAYGPPLIAGPSTFATSAAENATESHLTWLGSYTFAPGADTPADSWLAWVNGKTPANNWAIYANPVVQKCDDAWTSGVNLTTLKQLCTAAQLQINNDAPYAWFGSLKLIVGSGSVVWDKRVIAGGLIDPVYTGQSDTVIFNTITFTNGQ
jgi:ABC-type transport system substrate-binding protein